MAVAVAISSIPKAKGSEVVEQSCLAQVQAGCDIYLSWPLVQEQKLRIGLDAEAANDPPSNPSPTVDSSRRLCFSSSPSVPLGSARTARSARADEVHEKGSAAAAATSDARVSINTRA